MSAPLYYFGDDAAPIGPYTAAEAAGMELALMAQGEMDVPLWRVTETDDALELERV